MAYLRNWKSHPRTISGDRGDLKEKVFDAMQDFLNRLAITINWICSLARLARLIPKTRLKKLTLIQGWKTQGSRDITGIVRFVCTVPFLCLQHRFGASSSPQHVERSSIC